MCDGPVKSYHVNACSYRWMITQLTLTYGLSPQSFTGDFSGIDLDFLIHWYILLDIKDKEGDHCKLIGE